MITHVTYKFESHHNGATRFEYFVAIHGYEKKVGFCAPAGATVVEEDGFPASCNGAGIARSAFGNGYCTTLTVQYEDEELERVLIAEQFLKDAGISVPAFIAGKSPQVIYNWIIKSKPNVEKVAAIKAAVMLSTQPF